MRWRQIQGAAKEIFMRKGFNSTTMVDIAEKAELSPATIYQYFNSKEDLYASLNLITLRYLFDHVAKVHNLFHALVVIWIALHKKRGM